MWNGQMSLKGPTSTMHGPTLLVLINELDAFNLPLTCYTWPLGKYSLGCVVVFLSEFPFSLFFFLLLFDYMFISKGIMHLMIPASLSSNSLFLVEHICMEYTFLFLLFFSYLISI